MVDPEKDVINSNPRICDPGGSNYLEFYSGIFDAVYCALNPFVSIPELDIRKVFLMDEDEIPAEPSLKQINETAARRLRFFKEQPTPKAIADLEKRSGTAIRWETVRQACKLSSIADLCRAELGRIGALRDNLRNQDSENAVWQYCLENNVFPPREDRVPTILEQSIATLFHKLNYSSAILSDAFGCDQCEFKLNDLFDAPWKDGLVHFDVRRIYPPDTTLLVVVGFDTVVTKICGNRSQFSRVEMEDMFEGFWSSSDTDDLWWLSTLEKQRLGIQ
ncbi:MAG: DUF2711 domain-containing protein [Candidatus Obscuribacterales bacterium]|nr:DUF2711 domain-containing protein [Candidatus Obscuribacterales bacterium]